MSTTTAKDKKMNTTMGIYLRDGKTLWMGGVKLKEVQTKEAEQGLRPLQAATLYEVQDLINPVVPLQTRIYIENSPHEKLDGW